MKSLTRPTRNPGFRRRSNGNFSQMHNPNICQFRIEIQNFKFSPYEQARDKKTKNFLEYLRIPPSHGKDVDLFYTHFFIQSIAIEKQTSVAALPFHTQCSMNTLMTVMECGIVLKPLVMRTAAVLREFIIIIKTVQKQAVRRRLEGETQRGSERVKREVGARGLAVV